MLHKNKQWQKINTIVHIIVSTKCQKQIPIIMKEKRPIFIFRDHEAASSSLATSTKQIRRKAGFLLGCSGIQTRARRSPPTRFAGILATSTKNRRTAFVVRRLCLQLAMCVRLFRLHIQKHNRIVDIGISKHKVCDSVGKDRV